MVGTLILSQPTLVFCTNFPHSCTNNNLTAKYRHGFSIWVYSIPKLGTMTNAGPHRQSVANKLDLPRTGELDRTIVKDSVLLKSSEFEDMCWAIGNSVLCSRRQLMAVATVLALCSESKTSIAVESAKQGDDSSAQERSGASATESGSPKQSVPKKNIFTGLLSTQSWYRFRGDGFTMRVPPDFDDIAEPEDYSAGSSLYGERAKPKKFAARFASPDRSEVLSVVIRPSNELKLTFLEAKDISDLGSLRDAASLFVPGGATLHAARTIKLKESEVPRTYYFYEFSAQDRHVALEAAVSRGKVFVVGATAPRSKWEDDGSKLRSAAISFALL